MQPLEFTIATRDFDLNLLPAEARQPGTDAFHAAVAAFYADQFAPVGGSAIVAVTEEEIHVQWIPDNVTENPRGYVLSLLQSGQVKEAVPLLEAFLLADPSDGESLYNLGMVFSDLGHLDRAQELLTSLTKLSPDFANGWIALGVARQRAGDTEGAMNALKRAVELEPGNGYAHRNLGALLGKLELNAESLNHLRKAAELLPGDPASLYGLAQALEATGSDDDMEEADNLYVKIISMAGDSRIGDAAKQARSKLAQKTMRERTGGGVNMAAVMYCLGAMQRFDTMSPQEMQGVVMEIAILGQRGIDTNDSTAKYQLRSLPGVAFSGLQLMSMMYVGFKQIAPDADIGFDLAEEYRAALQMHEAKS